MGHLKARVQAKSGLWAIIARNICKALNTALGTTERRSDLGHFAGKEKAEEQINGREETSSQLFPLAENRIKGHEHGGATGGMSPQITSPLDVCGGRTGLPTCHLSLHKGLLCAHCLSLPDLESLKTTFHQLSINYGMLSMGGTVLCAGGTVMNAAGAVPSPHA